MAAGKKANKAVPAGEDPFIDELSGDVDFDALGEDEDAEEEVEEEEEEEEEEELEEVETPPAPPTRRSVATPAKTPKVAPPAKVAKAVKVEKAGVVVKTAKKVAAPKGESGTTRSRLAAEIRVGITDLGRSLEGKGTHDAIAGILRARKSGSATVGELVAKLMASYVPRTAEPTEAYFRAYIGAALRRGYVTIVQ